MTRATLRATSSACFGLPNGGGPWALRDDGWSRSGTPGRRWLESSRPDARRWFVMRVNVFGLGYVGCVTAACLAKAGHEVIGVDITPEKVVMVNDAVPPVVEPGLGEVLAEA